MERPKCSWDSTTRSASAPQHPAVVGLEFTTSALDESVARNMMGIKSSPKMLQQSISSGNNTTMQTNMEAFDRQFQRPQTMINEHQRSVGISSGSVGYANSRTAANTFFPNWEHIHPLHDRLIKKTEKAEASGSAPESPAGHSGAINAYTKQALDDLVSKILDEDSNTYHLNGATNHVMNCDQFKHSVGNQGAVENAQFGCNIWTNPKLPAQYVQSESGTAADKQWKLISTSSMSGLRMPPGLTLPASSQQQYPGHQISRQACAVPPNEAGWLKYVEPTTELAGASRCYGMVPNGNPQNTGGNSGQQQQALLLAQVQATLHALQSCQQQPASTDPRSQPATVSQVPTISQRPPDQNRFGITGRKLDEAVIDAQQSIFVNGKDACVLPATGVPDVTTSSANGPVQRNSSGLQQGQMLDLTKCIISTTHDGQTAINMQPFPVPQQAFMHTLCNEPLSNLSVPSRRLLPACFQDSSQPFVRSTTAPLNVATEKMQFEQNQLLVHGPPNLRCNQSAWNGNNSRHSPYSQYCVPSNASTDQYSMVGRVTPVMVGPTGDLFCSSVPSQIGTMPSPVMVGSKFPSAVGLPVQPKCSCQLCPTAATRCFSCRNFWIEGYGRHSAQIQLNASSELYVRLEECFEQLHLLEKEEKHMQDAAEDGDAGTVVMPSASTGNEPRSKAEAELAQQTPGRIASSSTAGSPVIIPKLPHNPTRVDRLYVESLREHSKVTSLVGRLWQCRGLQQPLHSSIYSVMETWMEGIRKVQARRKEEMVGMANRNHSNPSRVQDNKVAVTELLNHTRRARTALWCAVQMTSTQCAYVSPLTDNSHDHRITDIWHSPRQDTEPLDTAAQKC